MLSNVYTRFNRWKEQLRGIDDVNDEDEATDTEDVSTTDIEELV